jgi:hypothetical protein
MPTFNDDLVVYGTDGGYGGDGGESDESGYGLHFFSYHLF